MDSISVRLPHVLGPVERPQEKTQASISEAERVRGVTEVEASISEALLQLLAFLNSSASW